MQGIKNNDLGGSSSKMLGYEMSSILGTRLVSRRVFHEKGREVDVIFENLEITGKKGGGYSKMVFLSIVHSLKSRFCTRYLGVQDMSSEI